jgi:hypothetical protein
MKAYLIIMHLNYSEIQNKQELLQILKEKEMFKFVEVGVQQLYIT